MSLIPGQPVAPPEPRGRRYGLFTAASGPLDLPAPHAEGGGIRYVPTSCGEAYAYGIACYEPGEAPEKPKDGDADEVQSGVFLTLATLECTQVGQTEADMRAKVRRRLEDSEQATVERVLWTGLDYQDNELGVLNLDDEAEDVDPSGYDASSIVSVIGALEQDATDRYAFQPYLHASTQVAAYAADAGLIVQDGPIKRTPMGSVWVFGAYPTGEVIASGQVTLWRAPDVQLLSAFDTARNLRLLVAERAWAASFDCFASRASFDPAEG